MSHFQDRQQPRNARSQQRRREESLESSRNRLERHTQGEHSGQNYDQDAESRWADDPTENFAYPRQSYPERSNDEYDPRYTPHSQPEFWRGQRDADPENSNREWVSGTGQPPYRAEREGSRPRQSFAGRGPQGYQRSDDRIMEDINEALTQDHALDASHISVEVKAGEVILKGTVSDRESKRRAEELAEACSGVKDVQNQIRIQSTRLAS
jgi:hypothetical protein